MRGLLTLVFASSFVFGCGGGAEEPPKPLSRHFDEMYIAAIPVDQQKASFDAQHEWTVSRAEDAKANADLNEANMQLGIARNDAKAAHLAVDNAISAKKAASQSADMNRENQAQKDLHAAEDNEKAAKARVAYLEAYVRYMRGYTVYTLANMYAHEAQFEATKAQIAKEHNIAPKNVSYEWFPKQKDERGQRLAREKQRSEKGKATTLQARQNWLQLQKTADTESGHTSTAWDPMLNKPEGATAGAGEIQQQVEPTSGLVETKPAPAEGCGAAPQ
jgi:hypothetical protein